MQLQGWWPWTVKTVISEGYIILAWVWKPQLSEQELQESTLLWDCYIWGTCQALCTVLHGGKPPDEGDTRHDKIEQSTSNPKKICYVSIYATIIRSHKPRKAYWDIFSILVRNNPQTTYSHFSGYSKLPTLSEKKQKGQNLIFKSPCACVKFIFCFAVWTSLMLATYFLLLLFHVTTTSNQLTNALAHFQVAVPTLLSHTGSWITNQLAVNKGQNCTKPPNQCRSRLYCRLWVPSPRFYFTAPPAESLTWRRQLICSR